MVKKDMNYFVLVTFPPVEPVEILALSRTKESSTYLD
jgi:hypothetical protein